MTFICPPGPEVMIEHNFSKNLPILTIHSKSTEPLTFENFFLKFFSGDDRDDAPQGGSLVFNYYFLISFQVMIEVMLLNVARWLKTRPIQNRLVYNVHDSSAPCESLFDAARHLVYAGTLNSKS